MIKIQIIKVNLFNNVKNRKHMESELNSNLIKKLLVKKEIVGIS